MCLHQTTEFSALVRQALYDLLHFGKTDLAFLHKLLHLAFSHAELLGQFGDHRDAPAGELVQVLCIKPSLGHGGAVKIDQIVQRDGKSGSDVTQADQRLVHFLRSKPVGKKLLGTLRDILQAERSGRGRMYQLLHQGVGLLRTAEHGLKRHLQLLELAAYLGDVRHQLLDSKGGRQFADGVVQQGTAPVKFPDLSVGGRCLLGHPLDLAHGLVKTGAQMVHHKEFYLYRFHLF